MNIGMQVRPVLTPRLLSWGAKICAVILFSVWLIFVITEIFTPHFQMPNRAMVYQAIALFAVFWGYLLSAKHPIMGSLLAILAVMSFFVTAYAFTGAWPQIAAMWFVLPAVLTLGACGFNYRRRLRRRQRLNG